MGRRTILLITALVIAALGTTLVFLYVAGVEDEAAEGQEQVEILVASGIIPTGTSAAAALEQGLIDQRTLAAKDAAAGAVSDVTPIADKVAIGPIFPGEQILEAKFGEAGAAGGIQEQIPDGKMAVSVQLGDPARVAGFVEPGSEVAVFLTVAGRGQEVTQVLLPEVTVIGAGATTLVSAAAAGGEAAPEDLPKALLTLAVTQEEAQKVVYGSQHGQLYFGLLTDASEVDPDGPATNANNLFD